MPDQNKYKVSHSHAAVGYAIRHRPPSTQILSSHASHIKDSESDLRINLHSHRRRIRSLQSSQYHFASLQVSLCSMITWAPRTKKDREPLTVLRRRPAQPNARKVKPLLQAPFPVTPHHLPVAVVIAVAIPRLIPISIWRGRAVFILRSDGSGWRDTSGIGLCACSCCRSSCLGSDASALLMAAFRGVGGISVAGS